MSTTETTVGEAPTAAKRRRTLSHDFDVLNNLVGALGGTARFELAVEPQHGVARLTGPSLEHPVEGTGQDGRAAIRALVDAFYASFQRGNAELGVDDAPLAR
jgi:hypothetical protein